MQSESFRNARFNLKGATMQYYQIIKQNLSCDTSLKSFANSFTVDIAIVAASSGGYLMNYSTKKGKKNVGTFSRQRLE